jgi:outer membrane cobalamin receptor
MKHRFIAVLATLAMLGGTVGLASATDDGVYRLGEVVVSGQGTGVEAIGTTHKVTAEEIEKRGARTLDEAINMLPGVQVRTAADGAPRIDMRGFRTRHVKLLLNGTPFNSTSDGQFDPSLISVENIAEIIVTTGGGSELYGSGGNAGVINIITKTGTNGMNGSLGAELSEVDATLLRATGSYGTEKYDLFVSGSYFERDAYKLSNHYSEGKYEDGDERENSDRDRKNFFVNLGYHPGDATLLGMTFSALKGERGKPPIALEGDKKKPGYDPFAKKIKYERQDDEAVNVQLVASHDFAGPLSVKGWAYYNTLDVKETQYTNSDYDEIKSQLDSKTEISGANLHLAYDLQNYGRTTLGLMVENDDYEAEDESDEKSDGDFQLYSASLEYEVSPLDKLGVVLGAGAHWQDRESDTEDDYSYLVGLTYDLFEGTRLKASHARKVRFPTIRDLYDTDDGEINEDLTAETTYHYEAGVEQVLPAKTLLSLTGFYIDIEDYIEKNEDDVRQNYEEYEFYGAEVAAENRYFDRLFLRASYTYMSTKDKSEDSDRDELQNRPEHKVTLESTTRLPWGLTTYAAAQYITNNYYYSSDGTEQDELPSVFLVDFKLNKSAANGAIDLYLGVDNMFDEDYEQSYGFPLAGRTFYGGATWKF